MKAVVLAAGLGQRLQALTAQLPKALVSVGGQPLLAHTLAFLHDPAITEIAVVSGYRSALVHAWLAQHAPAVHCFENPRYRRGSVLSVQAARDFCDEDLLLCNVDHLYPSALRPIVCAPATAITALCDTDRPLGTDDMKVQLRGARVTAIHKTLSRSDGGYIGMTLLPQAALPAYWRAADQTIQRHGDGAAVEWILGELIAQGHEVQWRDVSGLAWAEVDSAEDLRAAETFVATTRAQP